LDINIPQLLLNPDYLELLCGLAVPDQTIKLCGKLFQLLNWVLKTVVEIRPKDEGRQQLEEFVIAIY